MKKMFNVLIITLLTAASSLTNANNCNSVKHSKIPNITEKNYHQARKQLVKNHWQPLRTLSANSTESDLGYGNGWIFWIKGYKEVESCAGTGLAQCVFNFKDVYGNILKVYTEGEEGDGYHAGVSSYQLRCLK